MIAFMSIEPLPHRIAKDITARKRASHKGTLFGTFFLSYRPDSWRRANRLPHLQGQTLERKTIMKDDDGSETYLRNEHRYLRCLGSAVAAGLAGRRAHTLLRAQCQHGFRVCRFAGWDHRGGESRGGEHGGGDQQDHGIVGFHPE